MKRIITLIAFAFGSTLAIAQQDPQFSQYMFNKLFMNPAYAGMRKAFCVSAIYRNQWNGFDGAPNTGVFSADLALPDRTTTGSGVGLNVMYDKLGFENNLSFRGNYSFHIRFDNDRRLGIGVEVGGYSKRIGPTGNQQWVATSNWQNDGTIPPLLKKTVMDMGLGLWYQDKKMWFGISSTHLDAAAIDNGTPQHKIIYQMARHYFVTGGITFFETPDWKFKSSFLVKTDATITSFDLNATAVYNNRFWVGASWRAKDAVCPMAGFMIPLSSANDDIGLKVGFAYDYTTSQLKNYSNGSLEVFLNYCLPVDWTQGIHFDVRNFK
jgi:type IX secretion system PorP/SprF family membrane protein